MIASDMISKQNTNYSISSFKVRLDSVLPSEVNQMKSVLSNTERDIAHVTCRMAKLLNEIIFLPSEISIRSQTTTSISMCLLYQRVQLSLDPSTASSEWR